MITYQVYQRPPHGSRRMVIFVNPFGSVDSLTGCHPACNHASCSMRPHTMRSQGSRPLRLRRRVERRAYRSSPLTYPRIARS